MRSLRILWALFRKNNTQPGFLATIWLLLLALIVPVIDIIHRVPAPAWLGTIGWLCFLGMSAGAGSFAIDTKHRSTRFLEYLPIRRWQIWLGNFGDGFLWLLGTILVASAYRTTHWIAPMPNGWGYLDEFEEMLFRGRFSLVLTMMGFTFCAFSVATFYRTITERDMSAIVRGVVASMLIIGVVAALPQLVGILPGADEMAVPLLVIGAAYSLASLLLFVIPIRHWHGFFRWLIRSWFASALYALTLGMIYVFALQWVRYKPQASDKINCQQLTSGVNAVQVWSRRSGMHLLDVDLSNGQYRYVGRGVSALKIDLPDEAKSVTFLTTALPPIEEWLNQSGFFRSAGNGSTDSGFPNDSSMTANGQAYEVRGKVQALDAQTFICQGARRQPRSASEFCVCDARGRIAWHVPMEPGGDILLRADGVALFCAPGPEPVPYSVNRSLIILMNVRSGEQTKVQLPGQLLDCAPDLSACVCLIYETRNEVTYRRLVVVDLPSGKQRAGIGEDQLPPVPYVAPSNSGYSQFIRSFRHDFGAAYWEDLGLIVDDHYRYLVWTAALNEPPGTVGIRLFDLQTGDTRTLVSPPDLGTRKSLRVSIPHLIGFSPNADTMLFETSQGIHRVAIDGSSHQVIAKRPENVSSVNWSFSPDRTRVLAERASRDEGDEDKRDYLRLLELWEDGNSTELCAAQYFSRPSWLNDREVVWNNDREILIFDVQTRARRCAFSVNDLLQSPASDFAPRP